MLRRTLTALAAVAAIGILLAPVDASARRGGGGFHGGGRAVAFHGGGGRIAAFHGGGFRAARVAHDPDVATPRRAPHPCRARCQARPGAGLQ